MANDAGLEREGLEPKVDNVELSQESLVEEAQRLIEAVNRVSEESQSSEFKRARSEADWSDGPIEVFINGEKYEINYGTQSIRLYWQGSGENPPWAEAVFQVPPKGSGGRLGIKPLISFQSPRVFAGEDKPGKRQPVKNTPLAVANAQKLVERFQTTFSPVNVSSRAA